MDQGQNPISPMPSIGSNSGASPIPNLNSRRNRPSRPNSANVIPPVQPMAPSGGMVVDAPTPRTKSPINKGLIIGLIVAIVAVVGGIVALTVLPKGNGGTNSSLAAKNYQEAFNLFANYFVYGKESTQPLEGTYERYKAYQLDNVVEQPLPERKAFFTKASDFLQTFKTLYNQTEVNNKDLTNTADSLASSFNSIKAIFEVDFYNEEQVKEIFLSGKDPNQLIREEYESLVNSEDPDVSAYAKAKINEVELETQYLVAYQKNNCIKDKEIIASCANAITADMLDFTDLNDVDADESTTTITDENIDAPSSSDILTTIIQPAMAKCWYISNDINGVNNGQQ